jgi:hypothetical protein
VPISTASAADAGIEELQTCGDHDCRRRVVASDSETTIRSRSAAHVRNKRSGDHLERGAGRVSAAPDCRSKKRPHRSITYHAQLCNRTRGRICPLTATVCRSRSIVMSPMIVVSSNGGALFARSATSAHCSRGALLRRTVRAERYFADRDARYASRCILRVRATQDCGCDVVFTTMVLSKKNHRF